MSEVLEFPSSEAIRRRVIQEWCDVQAEAAKQNIQLNADGTFTGRAEGKVEVGSTVIRVTLTSRPRLVPLFLIRSRLAKLLE